MTEQRVRKEDFSLSGWNDSGEFEISFIERNTDALDVINDIGVADSGENREVDGIR